MVLGSCELRVSRRMLRFAGISLLFEVGLYLEISFLGFVIYFGIVFLVFYGFVGFMRYIGTFIFWFI